MLCAAVYHKVYNPPPENMAARVVAAAPGSGQPVHAQKLLEAYTVYRRLTHGVLQAYSEDRVHRLNADQPLPALFEEAMRRVLTRERSHAPHNPRVLLIGPPGSGKSTVAELLADKYKLVNVDCGGLIRQAVSVESKVGISMRPYVEKHMAVPDALVVQLLAERLARTDCRTRGWVLHGFPRTLAQAEQLEMPGTLEARPTRVFFLHVPASILHERLAHRALDPDTGAAYHLVYNPPPNSDVAARLMRRPADQDARVRARLQEYQSTEAELREHYGTLGVAVDAEQDPHTVFEAIESRTTKPMPRILPGTASIAQPPPQ